MAKLKSIRFSCINWHTSFEDANGTYYDYIATVYSRDSHSHELMKAELLSKGWREIVPKDTMLALFLKDKHLIRVYRIWTD